MLEPQVQTKGSTVFRRWAKLNHYDRQGDRIGCLGREKLRTEDAIITKPYVKHAKAILALLHLEDAKEVASPGQELDLTAGNKQLLPQEQESAKRSWMRNVLTGYCLCSKRASETATEAEIRRLASSKASWQIPQGDSRCSEHPASYSWLRSTWGVESSSIPWFRLGLVSGDLENRRRGVHTVRCSTILVYWRSGVQSHGARSAPPKIPPEPV